MTQPAKRQGPSADPIGPQPLQPIAPGRQRTHTCTHLHATGHTLCLYTPSIHICAIMWPGLPLSLAWSLGPIAPLSSFPPRTQYGSPCRTQRRRNSMCMRPNDDTAIVRVPALRSSNACSKSKASGKTGRIRQSAQQPRKARTWDIGATSVHVLEAGS